MATEFFIHKMTEHMETARIVRWLVAEGEEVCQYQPIIEIETEKATVKMEAPSAGVVRGIRSGAVVGAEVNVGEIICWITAPGEEIPATARTAPSMVESQAGMAEEALPVNLPQAPEPGDVVRATPLARKLAKELGVDLAALKGTGPGGIIRDGDVRSALVAPLTGADKRARTTPPSSEWVALNRVQAVTTRRMLQSVQSTPQFSLLVETDATGLLSLRDSLEARVQSRVGVKLTLSMLFVKIVAGVLKNHPRANASFEEGPDGQPGVRLHPRVNCGVAVGSEEGLLVPVIHDAGARSLDEIALRLNELVEQIKSMRLAPADLEGGTFTISNLGMYGIRQFNAILNPPQSAILAIGAVTRRMVETPAGLTEMRPLVNLTLTADHRVLDGLQAARFLADLRAGIENPIDLMEKVA